MRSRNDLTSRSLLTIRVFHENGQKMSHDAYYFSSLNTVQLIIVTPQIVTYPLIETGLLEKNKLIFFKYPSIAQIVTVTEIVIFSKLVTPFLASRKCHYNEWAQ